MCFQVPRHLLKIDKVTEDVFGTALQVLRSQGAIVVDNVEFSEFSGNFTYSDATDWTLGLRVSIRESKYPISLGI